MTFEYQLTNDDITAFNLYHYAHSPTVRRQYYRALFVPALLWLVMCSALWYSADREGKTEFQTFITFLPLFSAVPLWLLLYPWLHRRGLHQTVAAMADEGRNRDLFGWYRVSLAADGITEQQQHSHRTYSWQAVERVVNADDYLYIYVNALAAIIIPRRAFATDAAWDELVGVVLKFAPGLSG